MLANSSMYYSHVSVALLPKKTTPKLSELNILFSHCSAMWVELQGQLVFALHVSAGGSTFRTGSLPDVAGGSCLLTLPSALHMVSPHSSARLPREQPSQDSPSAYKRGSFPWKTTAEVAKPS